jgi:AraC family transcriptional regulator
MAPVNACPQTPLSGHVAGVQSYGKFQVLRRILPHDKRLSKHRHPFAILTVVTLGAFEERMLYRTDECKVQDLRYQPAYEPHANRFWKTAECVQFELSDGWLKQIEEATGPLLLAGSLKNEKFAALAMRLASEARCLRPTSDLVFEPLILEILSNASRKCSSNSGGRPAWLELVREMIIESSGPRVTLAQLAESAGVHPVHLCRAFHRHFHCTIGEMIRKIQLERACHALGGGVPLAQVALSCGFSDQSHFCRVFRRELGVTPARYRATRCAS